MRRTLSGQPMIENGHRPDENQVSRTSSSCSSINFLPPASAVARCVASSRFLPTIHLRFHLRYRQSKLDSDGPTIAGARYTSPGGYPSSDTSRSLIVSA
jgi:hypothetical protein